MNPASIAALITAVTGLIAALGAFRHSQNTRARVTRRKPAAPTTPPDVAPHS